MYAKAKHYEFSEYWHRGKVLETTRERVTGLHTKDQNQNDILFFNKSTEN